MGVWLCGWVFQLVSIVCKFVVLFEVQVLPETACCVASETINFTSIPPTDQRLDCRMLLGHFSGIH